MRPTPSNSPDLVVDARGPATVTDTDDTASAPADRRLEIIVALVALACTTSLFLLATAIEIRAELPGMTPRSWPKLLAGMGIGLSAILLLTACLTKPQERSDLDSATGTGWVRLLLTVLATIAFLVLWPLVGFLPTAPFFISAITAIAGARKIGALVVYPLVTTAAIYVLFHLLLRVPL